MVSLSTKTQPKQGALTVGDLRKSTVRFLKRIGFEVGQRIWLKLSWDLPLKFAPDWECYEQKGEIVPVHKVFQGTITQAGFKIRRCRSKGKRRKQKQWAPYGQVYQDGWRFVYNLSKQGATVSFYPNQPRAGITNDDVKRCRCIFYEIDHLSINNQKQVLRKLCRELNLRPAGAIFSGGKSIHVYFRLNHDLKPEDWIRLNRKLCIVQNADPQICNLGRPMRLPGMLRRKVIDSDRLSRPKIVEVLSTFRNRYSQDDIEAKLDSTGLFPHGLDDQRWRKWFKLRIKAEAGEDVNPVSALLEDEPDKKAAGTQSKYLPRKPMKFTVSSSRRESGSTPLIECLTKEDSELIQYGVQEGYRNSSGFKLACNLVGTAGFLDSENANYYPEPEALFREFCDRCSPSLNQTEADTVWSSATSECRQPSRSEDSIRKTISYHYGLANSNPYAEAAAQTPDPDPGIASLIRQFRKKARRTDGTL